MSTTVTPKVGSSWHYGLIHSRKTVRMALLPIYHFYQEMMRASTLEPSVAQAKLAWWAQQFQMPTPQHPLIKSLIDLTTHYRLQKDWFVRFIASLQKTLTPFYFTQEQELLEFASHTGGALCHLIAGIQDEQYNADFATFAGISLTQIELIRRVGLNLKQQKLYIPLSDLELFQITPEQLLQGNIPEALWLKLLKHQSSRARVYYQRAADCLSPSQGNSQVSILINLALKHKLLDEIERAEFNLIDQQHYLTPLKKWWLAQKTCWQLR